MSTGRLVANYELTGSNTIDPKSVDELKSPYPDGWYSSMFERSSEEDTDWINYNREKMEENLPNTGNPVMDELYKSSHETKIKNVAPSINVAT